MEAGDVLLGKFRVERVLGRGGMGLVVAARHVELDELFAMKLMHPETLSNPEAIERFIREAKASARLKGEHVARVHDVGRLENGAPYMLMEHLVGDDLSVLIDKRGALPVREAALYVLQACEAIAEAHGQGIVHRDLKPANMFLTARANGTPCIKVLDFGISKNINPATKFGPTLTITGAFMGSPAFMSPEQMLNGKTVDTRSDIWALGAILYELTTGTLPFHGESMTELVARVMHDSATPPSALRPEIPHAFDNVVLTCLQKRAVDRYQSIEELTVALGPFAQVDKAYYLKDALMGRSAPGKDEAPDSALATRIVNPKPARRMPSSGAEHVDASVDAEGPTHVLLPVLPTTAVSESQSAVDSDWETATEYTIEMTTQVHLPKMAKQEAVSASNASISANTLRSPRLLLIGIAALSVLAIGVFVATRGESRALQDSSVDRQLPAVSAVPEALAKPMESVPAHAPAPTMSASPIASASSSTTSKPASTVTTRSAPTGKTRPTLY